MAAAEMNWIWPQGEDLIMQMVYQEIGLDMAPHPVNLGGYSLRMDAKSPGGARMFTFNSLALADVDPIVSGNQPDDVIEVILSATGDVRITVDRSLTLPPFGPLYQQLAGFPSNRIYNYDIFLRNPQGLQVKIIQGKITVEPSVTWWV